MSSPQNPLQGNCHCGAISITVPTIPTSINECQCTLCRRYGAAWAYYSSRAVTIIRKPDAPPPRVYIWGDRDLATNFCAVCGCVVYWEAVEGSEMYEAKKMEDGGYKMGINMQMMDPEQLRFVNRELNFGMALAPVRVPATARGDDKAVYR